VYLMTKCVLLSVAGAAALAAQANPGKQYKDPQEFDAYNAVIKDMTANNPAQAITDLDAWKKKYPQTDYQAEREVLCMKAFIAAKRYAQAVDEAGVVMDKGLEAVFADSKDGPGQELQLLYNAIVSVPMIADPTPAEVAAGRAVAQRLQALPRRPPNLGDADWTKLRSDVQAPAKAALVYLAILPGIRAMMAKPPDCAAAQSIYEKALEDYPDVSNISYNLGSAFACLKKTAPAIYEYERAAVMDPTLGGTRDAKQIASIADDSYKKVHGSAEGLEQLKQQVKQSPLPPAGFAIKTASEIAAEKEEEFSRNNPQLALWMKIKAALADSGGEQYFEAQLKNSAVPPLRGTLVEAKPGCHPKELLVAVPLPDAASGPAGAPPVEISLKLDKPLSGKPELGVEFQWQGVPTAFTASPFRLTMDTEVSTLQGLKNTPCGVPTARKK